MMTRTVEIDPQALRDAFGSRIQENVPLARLTAARIGGLADWLLKVETADALAEALEQLWRLEVPFFILGGGANVLISDRGVREVVLLNRARQIEFDTAHEPPQVTTDTGTNFGLLARQCATRGLGGLAWAAGIPGTVGGAVFGNAGAHSGDVAGNLELAEILHISNNEVFRENWQAEKLAFAYRSSLLKREPVQAYILSAKFNLTHSTPEAVQLQMEEFAAYRKRTQPPGASMGSVFKNPPGDYAGRLIEDAGLKGARIGGAEISQVHANFFINHEGASAADIYALIQLAQQRVAERFDVDLELEIELIGDFG